MITLDPTIAIATLLLACAIGFIAGLMFAEWLDYRQAQRQTKKAEKAKLFKGWAASETGLPRRRYEDQEKLSWHQREPLNEALGFLPGQGPSIKEWKP